MKQLRGLCTTCLGCGRLEDEQFTGVYICKNYIKAQADTKNYYHNLNDRHSQIRVK